MEYNILLQNFNNTSEQNQELQQKLKQKQQFRDNIQKINDKEKLIAKLKLTLEEKASKIEVLLQEIDNLAFEKKQLEKNLDDQLKCVQESKQLNQLIQEKLEKANETIDNLQQKYLSNKQDELTQKADEIIKLKYDLSSITQIKKNLEANLIQQKHFSIEQTHSIMMQEQSLYQLQNEFNKQKLVVQDLLNLNNSLETQIQDIGLKVQKIQQTFIEQIEQIQNQRKLDIKQMQSYFTQILALQNVKKEFESQNKQLLNSKQQEILVVQNNENIETQLQSTKEENLQLKKFCKINEQNYEEQLKLIKQLHEINETLSQEQIKLQTQINKLAKENNELKIEIQQQMEISHKEQQSANQCILENEQMSGEQQQLHQRLQQNLSAATQLHQEINTLKAQLAQNEQKTQQNKISMTLLKQDNESLKQSLVQTSEKIINQEGIIEQLENKVDELKISNEQLQQISQEHLECFTTEAQEQQATDLKNELSNYKKLQIKLSEELSNLQAQFTYSQKKQAELLQENEKLQIQLQGVQNQMFTGPYEEFSFTEQKASVNTEQNQMTKENNHTETFKSKIFKLKQKNNQLKNQLEKEKFIKPEKDYKQLHDFILQQIVSLYLFCDNQLIQRISDPPATLTMTSFSETLIEKLSAYQNFYKTILTHCFPKFRPLTEIDKSMASLAELKVADGSDLQQLQQKALTFLKNVKEIAEKVAISDNLVEPLKKENTELRKYQQKLEVEVMDQQSVQEKMKKQIDILHSEIRNLEIELTIKQKESVSKAEKEHMKINLLKFLQSAMSKNSSEGETYLNVLFKLIGITDQEGEELKRFIPEKTDRKRGLLSLIIRK